MQIILSAAILAHFSTDTTSALTRLSTSTPIGRINEEQMIAFNCRVWNIEARQSVIITRHTEDIESETLSWDSDILANIDDRFFLAVRSQTDGSVSYFLVVMDVTRRDSGRYICQIFDKSEGRYIAEEGEVIEVNYLPSSNNPICTPRKDLTFSPGMAAFNCTSEAAKPPVTFQWSRVAGGIRIPTESVTKADITYSEIRLNITSEDSGAVFLCTIRSAAFPEFNRKCFVGPIEVTETNVISDSSFGGATVSILTTGYTNSLVDICKVPCPFFRKSQMWIVLLGAIVLIIVILPTWIFYMHRKLHQLKKTSTFYRPPVLPIRSEEDVYVEMSNSNKSSHEDDWRTYMTLERPRIEYMAYPIVRPINRIEEDALSLEAAGSTGSSSGFSQGVMKRNI